MKRLLAAAMMLCALGLCAAEEGLASWYAGKFQGRRTASGEIFDTRLMTAAHRTLPFGTLVRVRNLDNGREVVVRVNDRGPFVEGRIIDLSRAAAEAIGMTGSGVTRVSVEVVGPAGPAGDAGPGRYTVQVAAFVQAANAERAVARLAAEGLQASSERGPDGIHRVRVTGVPASSLPRVRDAAARAWFPAALAVPES